MPLITCDKCKFAKDKTCTLRAPVIYTYLSLLRECDTTHYYDIAQPHLPESNQCGEGEPKPEPLRMCKHCGHQIWQTYTVNARWVSAAGNGVLTSTCIENTTHEPADVTP